MIISMITKFTIATKRINFSAVVMAIDPGNMERKHFHQERQNIEGFKGLRNCSQISDQL